MRPVKNSKYSIIVKHTNNSDESKISYGRREMQCQVHPDNLISDEVARRHFFRGGVPLDGDNKLSHTSVSVP